MESRLLGVWGIHKAQWSFPCWERCWRDLCAFRQALPQQWGKYCERCKNRSESWGNRALLQDHGRAQADEEAAAVQSAAFFSPRKQRSSSRSQRSHFSCNRLQVCLHEKVQLQEGGELGLQAWALDGYQHPLLRGEEVDLLPTCIYFLIQAMSSITPSRVHSFARWWIQAFII